MSPPPVSIHDAFFKQIIGEPAMADRFLREHLPPEITALLSEDLPEILPGSFVDENLAQHHTDLLFKLRLRGGEEALVHLVAEHKSAPDPMARLQLLRYVTRVLSDWHRKHATLPLPPVIPLLAHHGPAGWEISTEFLDLFGPVPGPLQPYLPSFRHALIDLARIPDEALSAHLRLRAFLKALKYILRKDLSQRIGIVLAEAGGLEMMDTVLILRYLDKGPVAVGREEVRAALRRLVPGRMEEIMGHLTQPAFEEGKIQGIEQGKAEGKAADLLLVLETRFGALSSDLCRQIQTADMASLEIWFKRAITAPDLTAIFGTRN